MLPGLDAGRAEYCGADSSACGAGENVTHLNIAGTLLTRANSGLPYHPYLSPSRMLAPPSALVLRRPRAKRVPEGTL